MRSWNIHRAAIICCVTNAGCHSHRPSLMPLDGDEEISVLAWSVVQRQGGDVEGSIVDDDPRSSKGVARARRGNGVGVPGTVLIDGNTTEAAVMSETRELYPTWNDQCCHSGRFTTRLDSTLLQLDHLDVGDDPVLLRDPYERCVGGPLCARWMMI
jgi:hypothetical protein